MNCTCGSYSLNPSLPKEKHPNYCDVNSKYSQKWNDFLHHMMDDYSGGRYLYVTDDRTRLAYPLIFGDILSGETAITAINTLQYQEIWIEEESCLAQDVYECAIKTQGQMSVVRMLRDL